MFIIAVLLLLALSCNQSIAFLSRASSLQHPTRFTLNMVKVGEIAPDFELKNAVGKSFKLSSFKGKKPVVVFFYPSDLSPGCTKEVCAFERKAPDFKAKGAEVFGISNGDASKKSQFIAQNNLKSTELLIDDKNTVRVAWQVPSVLFGAIPGRVTYVIGKDGTVKSIYDDIAKAELHPEKALEALASEPNETAKKNPFTFKF